MTTKEKIALFLSPLRSIPWTVTAVLIYSLFTGFYMTFLVYIIGGVTQAIDQQDMHRIKILLGIMIVMIVIHFLTKIFYRPTNFRIIRDITIYLDRIYLHKFMVADNNQVEKLGTGRMISIMQKGVIVRSDMLMDIARDKMVRVWTLIITLGVIAYKSRQFFLISLGVVLLVLPIVTYFGKRASARRNKVKSINIEMDRMYVRWIMSKFEIQQQGKYDFEIQKRKDLNDIWYNYKYKEKQHQAFGYDTLVLAIDLFLLAITRIISIGVFNGSYTVGDFVMLTGLTLLFQREVVWLQQEVRASFDNFIHIDRLMDTFADMKSSKNHSEWAEFHYKRGDISIQNLTYWYTDYNVLTNFSLDIKGGQKTALVWVSGSGKSTIIKLLAWYLTPDTGTITIDGQDLTDIALKNYYKHIGYLTQDPSVFDGTVYENLVYALDYVPTKAQIQKAIDMAQCDFFADFPDGLQTEIGEKGIRLSWGQRQRLAIAKIFLKDPEIILLDEPTSALDSISEEKIAQALHILFKERTVVVIAHRLQTVKEADDIIVLEKGEIIERGTHKSLTKHKGKYAKMLELQSGLFT